MRCPDGGGLTAEQQLRREQVRMQAAGQFAEGMSDARVAWELRVSRMSANQWRRALENGGREALGSKGAGGAMSRLDDARLARLEQALEEGPMAHGWDDQCWPSARIAVVIAKLFPGGLIVGGVCYLLHRLGWGRQSPSRRAVGRACSSA